MLEQKIKLNVLAAKTNLAFGVSNERVAEIYKKLIAVAKVHPRYSVIAESFLNCEDRFTEKERLYGLYALGKIKGMTVLMKTLNVTMTCNALTMKLEQKLLSLLTGRVKVKDPLLEKLLRRG